MNNNRNLFVAIGLSVLLVIGYQFLIVAPKMKAEQARLAVAAQQQKKPETPAAKGFIPGFEGIAMLCVFTLLCLGKRRLS